MQQQHTEECLKRGGPGHAIIGLDDSFSEECSCQCHADLETFDSDDNRYKWPEDRR